MTLTEYLKKLFGDKTSMTLEELTKASEGNAEAKFVDLKDGGYVDEGKFKGLESQLSAANTTIKDLQEAVKKFDGKDPEKLSADLVALQQKYDADTAKLRLDNALEVALLSSKARDTKAVRALLDIEKIKLDGDKLTGLEDQIEALKKSHDYMFEAEEKKTPVKTRVDSAKEHVDPPATPPATLAGALKERYESKG